MCGISQCHHLHVTDLAISSQILLQMSQNKVTFSKLFLVFLLQLLTSSLVSTLVHQLEVGLDLKRVCIDLC